MTFDEFAYKCEDRPDYYGDDNCGYFTAAENVRCEEKNCPRFEEWLEEVYESKAKEGGGK